jgi:hypothetical protein
MCSSSRVVRGGAWHTAIPANRLHDPSSAETLLRAVRLDAESAWGLSACSRVACVRLTTGGGAPLSPRQ